MKVFSYIVRSDSGFAPNPFRGTCTLACCKPKIRKGAEVGDLIVGLTTRSERIVYAMRVSKRIPFAEYWADPANSAKRPIMSSKMSVDRRGDNIYEPVGVDEYRQHPSRHSSKDGTEDLRQKVHDLKADAVLIAERYAYFGKNAPPVPLDLRFLTAGRGHRCRFTPAEIAAVQQWFEQLSPGVHGRPAKWRADDDSWMEP